MSTDEGKRTELKLTEIKFDSSSNQSLSDSISSDNDDVKNPRALANNSDSSPSSSDEIPESENLMVRISLFKRYQGSEKEDQVLKNQIETLDIPEGFNIRWLKSVDYTNGFSEMKS